MKKLYQIPKKSVIAIVAAILCFVAAVFELIITLDYIVQFGFDQLIITDLLYVGAAALSGLFILLFGRRFKIMLMVPYALLAGLLLTGYFESVQYAFTTVFQYNSEFIGVGQSPTLFAHSLFNLFSNFFSIAALMVSFFLILIVLLGKLTPRAAAIAAAITGFFVVTDSVISFIYITSHFSFYFPWHLFFRLFLFAGISLYFFSYRKIEPSPGAATFQE